MTEETKQEENKQQGFKIEVPKEELSKRKLFVATPMYGGMCMGSFTRSMADLTTLCQGYGIQLQIYFLSNESLIPRARNYCCDEFMRSNATHMMFIDADIGFNPHDVITLLAMMSDDSEYDVVGGPYPKKTIAWEKIKAAVDSGISDENPNILERFVGDYVFNPKGNTTQIPINLPVEVLEIGTGFMMIRRRTLEKFSKAFPQYHYRPDHVRTAEFDGTRKIVQYFQAEIDPKSERYLSEDYWFCQKIQELGLKTWLCPWMQMNHTGTYVFGGSLADLAAIGVAATADAGQMAKMKGQQPPPAPIQSQQKRKG